MASVMCALSTEANSSAAAEMANIAVSTPQISPAERMASRSVSHCAPATEGLLVSSAKASAWA